MPRFSAFTPFGMLAFSRRPSHAETIYQSMVSVLKDGISQEKGTPDEAETYADAMAIATARYSLERAGNSTDPMNVARELLPNLELDYQLRPAPRDSIQTRRHRLRAKMPVPNGGSYLAVWNALKDLLGVDFLSYRVFATNETSTYPADPLASIEVKASRSDLPPKYNRFIDPVANLGDPLWVAYASLDPSAVTVPFLRGEVVMASPENSATAERVTVDDVREVDGRHEMLATFAKSHDMDSSVTNMDWPYWWSTQRFALVVVTPSAAGDPEKRRLVHELMADKARGVSTWAIVRPKTLGDSSTMAFTLPAPIGAATMDPVAFSTMP